MFSQAPPEVVPETQPEIQPMRRRGKGKAKDTEGGTTNKGEGRGSPYNTNEDLVLISCYMAVSANPIIGTNQRYASLFKKVEEKFEDVRRDGRMSGLEKKRSHDSLRLRFKRMRDDINWWVICVDRATRVVGDRSGYNEANVTETAQEFYKEKSGCNAGFNLFKQWDAMKEYPEWETRMNLEETYKKAATTPRVDVLVDDDQPMESAGASSGSKRPSEDSVSVTPSKRPMGRDKAKKMARGGSSGNSSMDAMSEGWVNFNESYPQYLELERQKLEFARQKEERRMKEK